MSKCKDNCKVYIPVLPAICPSDLTLSRSATSNTIRLSNKIILYGATHELAGLLTAQDKIKLDCLECPQTGGGHTIQLEGVDLPQQPNFNFTGTGFNLTDDPGNDATLIEFLGGGGSNTITVTAGEDLLARDLIYIGEDGLAYKADAKDIEKEAVAILQDDISMGDTGNAHLGQTKITGYVGLTPNGRYFLSDTPGEITLTPPSGSLNIIQQVGKASSTTEFLFSAHISVLLPEISGTDFLISESEDFLITEDENNFIIE